MAIQHDLEKAIVPSESQETLGATNPSTGPSTPSVKSVEVNDEKKAVVSIDTREIAASKDTETKEAVVLPAQWGSPFLRKLRCMWSTLHLLGIC